MLRSTLLQYSQEVCTYDCIRGPLLEVSWYDYTEAWNGGGQEWASIYHTGEDDDSRRAIIEPLIRTSTVPL